jgi:uncharacterized cupredoxin-like copper-binding protein
VDTDTDTETTPQRSPWMFVASAIAAVGLALSVVALGGVITDDDPAKPDLLSAEDAANSDLPTIELGEMYIAGDLTAPADGSLMVVNAGAAPHNLTVEAGPHTPDLNGGDAYEMPLAPLTPATYTVFCSIPGHREAGMEAELVLE